jgi:hypothetical protein
MSLNDMVQFETQWLSAGRRLEELPQQWFAARRIRQEQQDAEMAQVQREIAQQQAVQRRTDMQDGQGAYREANGTNPRAAPPGQDPSIGEGEYLPAEMIRLGQLGANMNQAPQAMTMLPQLGLLTGGRQPGPTLGQLSRRTPPPRQQQPYTGV